MTAAVRRAREVVARRGDWTLDVDDLAALLAERDQLATELATADQALTLATEQLNDAHACIRAAEHVLDTHGDAAEASGFADDVRAALRGDQ